VADAYQEHRQRRRLVPGASISESRAAPAPTDAGRRGRMR
jgi:hypothetical protein